MKNISDFLEETAKSKDDIWRKAELGYGSVEIQDEKKIVAIRLKLEKEDSLVFDEKLPDLEYLNLSGSTGLRSISFPLKFPSLTHLIINGTGLESIEIPADCTKLKQIYLRKNENLKSVTFLGDCKELELIDFSNNKIKKLRLDVNMPELKYVYLGVNGMEELEISNDLPKLTILDVRNNKLKELPLITYTELETLYIEGNPLIKYQENEKKKDESGNAVGLISRIRSDFYGKLLNHRVKLIIVGNGRVGKTCLINCLKGEPCSDDQEYTHGIALSTLDKSKFPKVNQNPLEVKVWDFGGQEVFYATHQFFLTEESIYIYAWTDEDIAKANKERDKTLAPTLSFEKWRKHNYWLDNIRMHGKESPVLVVKTHCDDAREDFPYEPLKEEYKLLLKPLNFDAKGNQKLLDHLKDEISMMINGALGEKTISNSYNEIIKFIEKSKSEGKTTMARKELEKIANDHKIESKDFEGLLGYLKNVAGVIQYFEKESLKDKIFIDPDSLIKLVYLLIENNDYLRENEGQFTDEYAAQTIGQQKWLLVLPLMQEFELLFVKQTDQTYYIAPYYLKNLPKFGNAKDSFDGNKVGKELRFTIRFARFLPENIMINLLSKYGPYALGAVYRDAISFQKKESTEGCVIECNEDERIIRVYTGINEAALKTAKEVYQKFIELSKKTEVHISVNGGKEWALCDRLEEKLDMNKGIPEVGGWFIEEEAGFDFLRKERMVSIIENEQDLFDNSKKELDTFRKRQKLSLDDIKSLVGEGQTEKAIEELESNLTYEDRNLWLRIKSDYYKFVKDEIQNTIDSRDRVIRQAKLDKSILSLCDLIEKKNINQTITPPSSSEIVKSQAQTIEPDKSKSHQTILFASANPSDKGQAQTGAENRTIREEMLKGKNREFYKFLEPQLDVRIEELIRSFKAKPDIIHFAGHGIQEGILICNDQNESILLNDKTIERLFRNLKNHTKLVLLNNCYSTIQAELISTFGMIVIGNNNKIGDTGAIRFAKGFYIGLSEGMSYEDAFNDGMTAVLVGPQPESASDAIMIEAWKDGQKLDW